MLANPFVAILAAVVGLVTGFIYLWKTNEGFRDAVKTFGKIYRRSSQALLM